MFDIVPGNPPYLSHKGEIPPKEAKMKLVATEAKVTIKWFAVDTNGNKFRNTKGFISGGWDATCSCGWESRTGGAIKSYVISEVEAHKVIAHNYTWNFGGN
jgi:hypothetical protein